MKSKYHSGNVALLVIIIVLALIGIPVCIGAVGEGIDNASWERRSNNRYIYDCEPREGAYAKYIGDTYAAESEEGFGYVRVYVPVLNRGTQELSNSAFHIKIEDSDEYMYYSEVFPVYDDTDNEFKYDIYDASFPGQVAYVSDVYKIKNTVNRLKFTAYGNDDDYREKINGVPYDISIQR